MFLREEFPKETPSNLQLLNSHLFIPFLSKDLFDKSQLLNMQSSNSMLSNLILEKSILLKIQLLL